MRGACGRVRLPKWSAGNSQRRVLWRAGARGESAGAWPFPHRHPDRATRHAGLASTGAELQRCCRGPAISRCAGGLIVQAPGVQIVQQQPPGRLESAYIFVALMLVTQALEPLLLIGSSTSDDALSDSNPASLISALAIYAVAFVLLARKPGRALDTIKSNLLLVAVFALPVLSTIWS